MRLVFFALTVLVFSSIAAPSQNTTESDAAELPYSEESDVSTTKIPLRDDDRFVTTWSILVGFATTFDSNLEHDVAPVRAVGFIPSITAGYQLRSKHHRVRFIYGLAGSRYTRSTKLNLVGQYFSSSYRFSLGRWSWETEAEAIFKGANEDRETNNQFIGTQKIGFRFDSKTRATAYFAYRLKRYEQAEADRDAVNPMFGMKFSRRLTRKLDWEAGYRYDQNRAVNSRQSYLRSTYDTKFGYDLNRKNRFETDFSYRPRLYSRTVRVGDLRLPRHDHKLSLELTWQRQISDQYGVELGYGFERQTSNDSDKLYHSHQLRFAVLYRWGNGEAIAP